MNAPLSWESRLLHFGICQPRRAGVVHHIRTLCRPFRQTPPNVSTIPSGSKYAPAEMRPVRSDGVTDARSGAASDMPTLRSEAAGDQPSVTMVASPARPPSAIADTRKATRPVRNSPATTHPTARNHHEKSRLAAAGALSILLTRCGRGDGASPLWAAARRRLPLWHRHCRSRNNFAIDR